jgi:AAA family ATP:ADP antiporter
LLVLLNVVNTTGEFILSHLVTERADTLAAAAAGFDKKAYIGAFYGNYFLWVNIVALVLQGSSRRGWSSSSALPACCSRCL